MNNEKKRNALLEAQACIVVTAIISCVASPYISLGIIAFYFLFVA